MKYDFTKSFNREDTNAEKYTLAKDKFGTNDIIPVWVADMDLNSPPFIQKDIKKRLEHGIFGYEEFPNSAFKAQISWLKKQHNISFELNDVFYSHSIVSSIHVAIEAFTSTNDSIIVQTPVYGPFFTSAKQFKREIIYNELIKDDDGFYTMDLKSLKKQIRKNTKLLILCNPHNPVGRAWTKSELEDLLDICIQNNIIVFSDEAHCDLVYEPYTHIPFASLNKAKDITISAYGIGKTFNLSGLATSTVYIQNENLKQLYKDVYDKFHFASGNCLSHVAFQSAYTNGYIWIKELKTHLRKNYFLLKEICQKYPNFIKLSPSQATYLAWIDCRGLKMSDKKLINFFVKEAKLGLNRGNFFGHAGDGFLRLNYAMTNKAMQKVLTQLDIALDKFQNNKDNI